MFDAKGHAFKAMQGLLPPECCIVLAVLMHGYLIIASTQVKASKVLSTVLRDLLKQVLGDGIGVDVLGFCAT